MKYFGMVLSAFLALVAGNGAHSAPARQDVTTMSQPTIVALQRRLKDGGCYKGPLDGLASAATIAAVQECPDQRPLLVIETGMHVAPIQRIAVDGECSLMATASPDKTLRLWSIADGHLLRTIRPPQGLGEFGKLFATALSNDKRFVAVGGFDARFESKTEISVYIFDVGTGNLIARMGVFDEVVEHLNFSPDGRWLVANVANRGIAIFDVSSPDPKLWKQFAYDFSYKGHSYGSSWSRSGQLVVTGDDGKLRLYSAGPNFKQLAEKVTQGGKEMGSVAFNPAGNRVAVGYSDKPNIEIFDAKDLRRVAVADTNGVDNGDLSSLVWPAEGEHILAAGRFDIKGSFPLLSFQKNGKRPVGSVLVPLAQDVIFDLKNCGDGIAFASAMPSIGTQRGNDPAKVLAVGISADMKGKTGSAFTLSSDAKIVRFGLAEGAEPAVQFDLGRASLTEKLEPDAALREPRITGLPVTDWENTARPAFAKKPFEMTKGDISRALAIREDRAGFVLSTQFTLRAFNAKGVQLWTRPVLANAAGLNLSADGRLIVVASGDGTVRWHRWSDGEELLALFVNKITKAWVAWTPGGYYSASPGGEAMIGWQVNRGWDQAADFFPADRFKAQFARPDVVENILNTLDEAEAIKLSNKERPAKQASVSVLESLPPVISILSPGDGASIAGASLTIDYIVRSPSGVPVARVDARMDGRPVVAVGAGTFDAVKQCLSETQGLGRAQGALQGCRGSLTITGLQGSSEVSLAAYTVSGQSEAAVVRIVGPAAPAAPSAAAADSLKPKLYALVIGVADYINPAYRLGLPAKDAKDFAAALHHQKGGLYSDVTVQLITDRAATVASIKKGLEWLKRSTTARDVAVLYFAGHGELEKTTGSFYLLPADAEVQELFSTALAREDINRVLDQIPGKAIVFLDACHSGAIGGGTQTRGLGAFNVNDVVKDLANADNGVVLFTASTGKQLSLENPEWGNGAFTKAVVEGLGREGVGAKANLLGRPAISLSELDAFVASRVKELTNGAQSPVMMNPKGVPNFPLALAR